MRSSMSKLPILLFIVTWLLLAMPFDASGNIDPIEDEDSGRRVIIDGSDAQIICGDAVNLGGNRKANKLQENNGTICIVADDADKKEVSQLEID